MRPHRDPRARTAYEPPSIAGVQRTWMADVVLHTRPRRLGADHGPHAHSLVAARRPGSGADRGGRRRRGDRRPDPVSRAGGEARLTALSDPLFRGVES